MQSNKSQAERENRLKVLVVPLGMIHTLLTAAHRGRVFLPLSPDLPEDVQVVETRLAERSWNAEFLLAHRSFDVVPYLAAVPYVAFEPRWAELRDAAMRNGGRPPASERCDEPGCLGWTELPVAEVPHDPQYRLYTPSMSIDGRAVANVDQVIIHLRPQPDRATIELSTVATRPRHDDVADYRAHIDTVARLQAAGLATTKDVQHFAATAVDYHKPDEPPKRLKPFHLIKKEDLVDLREIEFVPATHATPDFKQVHRANVGVTQQSKTTFGVAVEDSTPIGPTPDGQTCTCKMTAFGLEWVAGCAEHPTRPSG